MVKVFMYNIIWLSNTIHCIINSEQYIWKTFEFFLMIVHLLLHWRGKINFSPILILAMNLIMIFEERTQLQVILFIVPIFIHEFKQLHLLISIQLCHLGLASVYLCLIELGDGFIIVQMALLSMMLILCQQQKDNQHILVENIITDSDRCQTDYNYNYIKLNSSLQPIQVSTRQTQWIGKLDQILKTPIEMADKGTKQFIYETFNRSPFHEYQETMSIKELLNGIQAQQKSHSDIQILGLKDYPDIYILIHIQDIIYLQIMDLSEFSQFLRMKHNQTTTKQLLRSFSHEFNTSLNYILALAQVAESNDQVPKEVNEKYFRPILNAGKIMGSVVSDIMDYNTILGKTFNLQVSQFQAEDLVKEVISLFQVVIQEKKLKITFENRLIRDKIYSDKQRIRQILINLISNAQKFTFRGEIKLVVESKEQNRQNFYTFHVYDTGIGMNKEEQERLNTLMQSGVTSATGISKNSAGFGLGLIISNKIAENLCRIGYDRGGGIRFENNSNKGFHVWFNVLSQNVSPLMRSELKTPIISIGKRITLDIKQTQMINKNRECRINVLPMRQKFSHILGLKKSDSFTKIEKLSKRKSQKGVHIARELLNAVQQKKLDEDSSSLNQECTQQEFEDRVKYIQKKPSSSYLPCKCPDILIADDEWINIMALKMMLEQLGLSSESVFNGQECVDLVKQNRKRCIKQFIQFFFNYKNQENCQKCKDKNYELIFMDINMPILDGLQASLEIKKFCNIIIIACTAFSDNETRNSCYANGMDYYLQKPVKKEQLIEVLQFYNFLT